ncbi:MAG TPA: RidA family protein, partial [Steroidobacteraceae bacterium]|nr:RidA family protein [Steroidobacteraceae bacterium]
MRLPSLLLGAALLVGFTSPALTQSRQIIGGTNASYPFSTAVKAGGFIYVSGAIGKNGAVSGDIKQQTRDTLDGIDATLKAGGSSLANAASVTVYLTSAADVAAMNEVYATYFKSAPPARTTVIVTTPLALPGGLVECSAIGIPLGAERTVIHPEGWAKVPAPYSYGIRSGNTLFMSGLVSRNGKDNSAVPGDMAAQTKIVMDNAAEVLKAAGMGFGDVVQSRVWYDAANNRELNPVYGGYFEGFAPPVRAAVRAGMPGKDYLVEVTMVAVKDASRKAIVPPNPDGSPGRAGGVLSPTIQVGNTLYLAGMLASTPENKGDIKAQTTATLERIDAALKTAGYDWPNIVDGLVYLADMSKFQDMNAAYRERFPKDPPARATIGVGLGGDALV